MTKLIFIAIALAAASLFIGPGGWVFNEQGNAILFYRLTRLVLVVIAGSSLAASGASLQALFQNPLADPHLFGISGGAAVGACIVIAFLSSIMLPSVGAIVGGLCALVVVFFYLRSRQVLERCLLVGIMINSVAAALITLLKTILPMHKTQSLLFWLVGHLSAVDAKSFFIIVPLWLCGMVCIYSLRNHLEILSFGMDEAQLLGIDAKKIVRIVIVANAILIGNVVAFAGMIGFIGLVTPHLCRLAGHSNLRTLLPLSSWLGAIFLLACDLLSRLSFIVVKSEIPIGAIAALFLSPIFFWLLSRDIRAHT